MRDPVCGIRILVPHPGSRIPHPAQGMIAGCNIASLAERGGVSRRSATACGAWPAGPERRRGVARVARSRGRARLQLLRHGLGLRRRAQRAAARRAAEAASRTSGSTSRPRSRRRTASGRRAPEYALDDVFPADYIREYTEKSLTNLGVADDRPAAVPRLDRHVGRATTAGSARVESERGRAGPRDRHQHQPLAAGERPAGARHRPHRRRAGRLQHLRPEPGGRAVPGVPRAGHRGHRARAVRRGQPDRHADARIDVARRRLPQHLLPAREPAQRRSSASSGSPRRCRPA